MISKETILKVNEAADIVEVIGDYVKLKKRGANYVGLSPFSNERTASFTVSPVKNIFKCFSSGKAGNVVSFLIQLESMTYPEAIKHLAAKYKIEVIEDNVSEESRESVLVAENLFLTNKAAAELFNRILKLEGVKGIDYFESRGVSDESIEKWQLGYGGYRGTDVKVFCETGHNAFSKEMAVKADVAFLDYENKLRDKYEDRIVFPFHNLSGRIVGFSGRTLKNDKTIAKYTNTKENEIFHKSLVLYGIFFARKAIVKADLVNIVEGQLDVISMHQHGFENTVGTGGTAITKEHLNTLKRFCTRVRFIFDGDEAGKKAVGRGIEMAVELGLNVEVLSMPDGDDPDSFLLKYGGEAFTSYSEVHTGDIVDFYMGDGKSLSDEQKQVNGRILIRLIAIIGNYDIFRRAPKVQKLAKMFNVDIRKLNTAIDKVQLDFVDREVGDLLSPGDGNDAHEIELVKVLLKYGHLSNGSADGQQVYYRLIEYADPDKFSNIACKLIITEYWRIIKDGSVPLLDYFTQYPNSIVSDFATNIAFEEFELSKTWEGLDEINPTYKQRVKSAFTFFLLALIRNDQEKLTQRIVDLVDGNEKNELLDEYVQRGINFRKMAEDAGITYIK